MITDIKNEETPVSSTKDIRSKGAIVTLLKLFVKEGAKTKIKPGKKRVLTLAKDIAIGHQICFKRKKRLRWYSAATQVVIDITPYGNALVIETTTSFYLVS